MSLEIHKILAALPGTRTQNGGGFPTHISVDPEGQRIAYSSGRNIYLRHIDDPSNSKQYTEHKTFTTVARFSPSGFYVASGDESGKVHVWDAVEGVNTKSELEVLGNAVRDVAWDPDSTRILVGGEGQQNTARIVSYDTGNNIGTIDGSKRPINAVAMRQQRPFRAATASEDMTMCFYHGAPFKLDCNKKNHSNFVLGVAFSPDGSKLVTTGSDRKAYLFDGKTAEFIKEIGEDAHKGYVFGAAWSKDSKRLATVCADMAVRVWDVEANSCLQTWQLGEGPLPGNPERQLGVAWRQGGAGDDFIISVNLMGDLTYMAEGKEKPVRKVQGHNKAIQSMAATADNKRLFSADFDGRVCSWDVASGLATVVAGESHTARIVQLASSSSSTDFVYSVGWDDTLRVIDVAKNTFIDTSFELSSQPKGVAAWTGRIFVALHSSIATYSNEKLIAELVVDFQPTTIAASAPFVAVGNECKVMIYQVDDSGNLSLVHELEKAISAITALAFSKKGNYLASGDKRGKTIAYKTDGWEVASTAWPTHNAKVASVAWNEDENRVVSGSLDAHISVGTLGQTRRIEVFHAHRDGVAGVAWVGEKIATTGADASVKMWTPMNLP